MRWIAEYYMCFLDTCPNDTVHRCKGKPYGFNSYNELIPDYYICLTNDSLCDFYVDCDDGGDEIGCDCP